MSVGETPLIEGSGRGVGFGAGALVGFGRFVGLGLAACSVAIACAVARAEEVWIGVSAGEGVDAMAS
jgi:hypothetical protein